MLLVGPTFVLNQFFNALLVVIFSEKRGLPSGHDGYSVYLVWCIRRAGQGRWTADSQRSRFPLRS